MKNVELVNPGVLASFIIKSVFGEVIFEVFLNDFLPEGWDQNYSITQYSEFT